MHTNSVELKIRGMICRSCVDEVETMLLHTRGVVHARASYARGLVRIEYDPALASPETLRTRLAVGGYAPGERGRKALVLDVVCILLTALLTRFLLESTHGGPELNSAAGFGAVFLTGLLTSPHCIGMCGGILLGQSVRNASPAAAALAYNTGRVLSYTVVGAVFGALGTALSYSMSVRSMVFTMAGLAIILIGLNLWGLLPGLGVLFPEQGSFCRLSAAAQKRFLGRPLTIGLLTGLMPCGSLYAMWLHAVSTGSSAAGAGCMFAFSLGTVPLLLTFGALGSLIPRRWNRYFVKGSAVLVLAIGLKMMIMGLRML